MTITLWMKHGLTPLRQGGLAHERLGRTDLPRPGVERLLRGPRVVPARVHLRGTGSGLGEIELRSLLLRAGQDATVHVQHQRLRLESTERPRGSSRLLREDEPPQVMDPP